MISKGIWLSLDWRKASLVSRLKRFLFTEVGVVRLLMIIPSLLKVKSFFRARIKNSDALMRNEFWSKTA